MVIFQQQQARAELLLWARLRTELEQNGFELNLSSGLELPLDGGGESSLLRAVEGSSLLDSDGDSDGSSVVSDKTAARQDSNVDPSRSKSPTRSPPPTPTVPASKALTVPGDSKPLTPGTRTPTPAERAQRQASASSSQPSPRVGPAVLPHSGSGQNLNHMGYMPVVQKLQFKLSMSPSGGGGQRILGPADLGLVGPGEMDCGRKLCLDCGRKINS